MPTQASGVFPHLAMLADHTPRTESGIGALMPWAGRLWAITCVAHTARTGSGTGLFEITPDLRLIKRPESVVGTYANRFVHGSSNQLFIGPHVIDTDGNVRTIDAIKDHRLTATCAHLTDPANKVHMIGMEREFWEVDARTLEARELGGSEKGAGLAKDCETPFQGRMEAPQPDHRCQQLLHGKAGRGGRFRRAAGGVGWNHLDHSGARCIYGGLRRRLVLESTLLRRHG